MTTEDTTTLSVSQRLDRKVKRVEDAARAVSDAATEYALTENDRDRQSALRKLLRASTDYSRALKAMTRKS